MPSLPGPGSRPPPGWSRRGSGSSSAGGPPGPIPCRCRRPTGSVASLRTPLFRAQVPSDRLPDLAQRVGHSQPGRVEWTALVIVENPANRGTVVQDHVARRIILGGGWIGTEEGLGDNRFRPRRWRRLPRSLVTPMVQHGLLDPPQAADFLPHLNLRMTVFFEDRLGQVAEEMVG